MSYEWISGYLEAAIPGEYGDYPCFHQVFTDGHHPSVILDHHRPPCPVAIVRFNLSRVPFEQREECASELELNVPRFIPERPGVVVRSAMVRFGELAMVYHGPRQFRSQDLMRLRTGHVAERREHDPCVVDMTTGIATALEALYALRCMRQADHVRGYEWPPSCFHPYLVRMMHEIAIRRSQMNLFRLELVRLAAFIMDREYFDWDQVLNRWDMSRLPPGIETLFALGDIRGLRDERRQARMHTLAGLDWALVHGRMDYLAKEVRRPTSEGRTAPTMQQRFEFYAIQYLIIDVLRLAGLTLQDVATGEHDAFPFDVMEDALPPLLETLPEQPPEPERIDHGPVGYRIIGNDDDPEDFQN